ncbi:hypothetical protein F0562_011450 [Nyssa sinensis]|uniref:Uncharacterized protein n=1 Tax=Nyssa sinensis TaxID=561372 RepID=A0A5J5A501_9ASTE|nr:hypothetical protein F0562_011450 [Nyssa sinensis]
MGIANNMRIHGEKIVDSAIVENIFRLMAPKFDFIVCSIEDANDIDEMSIDELQSALLEEVKVEVEDAEEVLKATEIEANTASFSREIMIRIEEEDRMTSPDKMISPKLSAIGVEIIGIIAVSATPRCQRRKKEETNPRLSAINVEIMGITAISATQSYQETKKEQRS